MVEVRLLDDADILREMSQQLDDADDRLKTLETYGIYTSLSSLKNAQAGNFPYTLITPNGRIEFDYVPGDFTNKTDDIFIVALNSTPVATGALKIRSSSSQSFVQNIPNAVYRTSEDKLRERVSVKDLGAKGDGIADDGALIQKALDSGATRIYFPKGKYITNIGLVVPIHVILEGDGTESSIIKAGATFPNATDVVTLSYQCSIYDLGIEGNYANQSTNVTGTIVKDSSVMTNIVGTVYAGAIIKGPGIPFGTFVRSVSGTSATISNSALSNQTAATFATANSGSALRLGNPALTYPLNTGRYITLYNVRAEKAPSWGMHAYEGGYNVFDRIICGSTGIDAVYLEGASNKSFTSTSLTSKCVLSNTPNGFGLRLKNCMTIDCNFVTEKTFGVGFEGENGLITFDQCYFETSADASSPYMFHVLNGGANGINVSQCWLSMIVQKAVFEYDVNYSNVRFTNNINLSTVAYSDNAKAKTWSVSTGNRLFNYRGMSSLLATQYAQVANVDTTTTPLWNYSLPGNFLDTNGQSLILKYWGKTSQNDNLKSATVVFGNTVLFDTTSILANDKDWYIEATIIRVDHDKQAVSIRGHFGGSPINPKNTLLSVELFNDVSIIINATGIASGDIVMHAGIIEYADMQGTL